MTVTFTDQFDPKSVAEIVPLTFDFARLTGVPNNPVVTVAHHAGTADPNPVATLVGSPLVVGSQVRIRVRDGVAGAVYRFSCLVDDDAGNRWELVGKLPVL